MTTMFSRGVQLGEGPQVFRELVLAVVQGDVTAGQFAHQFRLRHARDLRRLPQRHLLRRKRADGEVQLRARRLHGLLQCARQWHGYRHAASMAFGLQKTTGRSLAQRLLAGDFKPGDTVKVGAAREDELEFAPGGLPLLSFSRRQDQQRNPCSLGQGRLLFVKGQECIRCHFYGDGDVEEVHRPDCHLEGMLGRKFAGGADGIRLAEFDMQPVAQPDFLFEQADELPGFTFGHQLGALGLTEAVEHLHPLPRRPQQLRLGLAVKKADGRGVMDVAPAFAGQPPRSVRLHLHFLSERRKLAPSNSASESVPTARFSARATVIRGRAPFVTTNFGFPFAVTMICPPAGSSSTSVASRLNSRIVTDFMMEGPCRPSDLSASRASARGPGP